MKYKVEHEQPKASKEELDATTDRLADIFYEQINNQIYEKNTESKRNRN